MSNVFWQRLQGCIVFSVCAGPPVQAIAEGLRDHTSLEVLWLYKNRIGDTGLEALESGIFTGHE